MSKRIATTQAKAETGTRRATGLVAAALAGLMLAGCVTESGPKQGLGTILGAAGGGLLGAQFGSGRGQLAFTAAGVLLGSMLGNSIGRSLDKADKRAVARAEGEAHEAPVNETIHWRNPESGNYGSVTPVREGTTTTGRQCREYHHTVVIGGRQEEAYGTACLQDDGSWQIVNG